MKIDINDIYEEHIIIDNNIIEYKIFIIRYILESCLITDFIFYYN